MSISVTVSGEDSTSVVLTQALSDTVTVSETSAISVQTQGADSASVIVTEDNAINVQSNDLTLFLKKSETGAFYPASNPSGFITGVDLSELQTVTGDLNTRVNENESDILTVSGLITSNDGDISALQTATGLLVQKSQTGNFVTDSDTGVFYPTSNPSGYITGVDLSNYVQNSETGNFITDSDTGTFYATSNPSGFITGVDLSDLETATGVLSSATGVLKSDIVSNYNDISALQTATGLLVQKSETGNFITDSDTGAFYATSNPSGFITGVDLSSYVQDSETGLFLVSGEDAVVNTLGVGGAPDSNLDIHVKSTSAKFLVENTLAGGEWVRFSAGTVGSSMKFSNSGFFCIGPVANKTDTSTVDDFYMDSDGNVGIGTTSPNAKLHVNGTSNIDGTLSILDNTTFVADGDINIEPDDTSSGPAGNVTIKGGSTFDGIAGSNVNIEAGVNDVGGGVVNIGQNNTTETVVHSNARFEGRLTINGDITSDGLDVSLDGSNSFRIRDNGTDVAEFQTDDITLGGASQTAITLDATSVDIDGDLTVEKIALSANSFVIETGNFTLGSTHKGATVLLQNTSPITVTVPSQVSGHVTTFIAETINDVSFATGVGISGLNSFNGANSMLGQFAQAQIIFKTPEYAFLGGQIT